MSNASNSSTEHHERLNSWDELVETEGFCALPWVHLYASTQGKVTPCCLAPWEDDLALGDLNKQSHTEIWNGTPMKEIRSRMLHGIKDARCWQCHQNESLGLRSKRQTSNALYGHRKDWVLETKDDGTVINAKPIYWDIRISNLCNFKCRICGHHSSSKWFEDAKALGETSFPESLHYSIGDFNGFMKDMEYAFEEVEEIYFAGGEPLIMEEHYIILEKLMAKGRKDVKLRYATNFSVTKFKHWDVFGLWQNFDTVFLHTSLDGFGKRGEFQRTGQKWDEVLIERERLRKVAPHVEFMISPTVSIFNVMHLPDAHKIWVETGFVGIDDVIPHTLKNPAEYSIQTLTPKLKDGVERKIKSHINWLQSNSDPSLQKLDIVIGEYEGILRFMHAKNDTESRDNLRAKTQQLDALRNENAQEIFPELLELLS